MLLVRLLAEELGKIMQRLVITVKVVPLNEKQKNSVKNTGSQVLENHH